MYTFIKVALGGKVFLAWGKDPGKLVKPKLIKGRGRLGEQFFTAHRLLKFPG